MAIVKNIDSAVGIKSKSSHIVISHPRKMRKS